MFVMQILDIQLPEHCVANIQSVLESNNLPVRIPDKDPGRFNCWGFTAYYLKWEKTAEWLDAGQMDTYLKVRTNPIDKEGVKAGDIAVFRSGSYLTHTAIMLSPDVVCHKPGGSDLCINSIEAARSSYGNETYARASESWNGG